MAWLSSGKQFFELFNPPTIVARPGLQTGGRFTYPMSLACLLLVGALGFAGYYVSGREEINPERLSFATFPDTLGEWKGRPGTLESDVEKGLGLSDYVLTDYAKPKGLPVNLYVAYYASQRMGVSPHSPSVCIPGNGWQITEFEYINLRIGDTSLPINRAIITRGAAEKQLVYYWYEERGVTVANEYWSKVLLLKDAILANRTDGALVRLITPVYAGERESDADDRLQEFARTAAPVLSKYLPKAPSKSTAGVTPPKLISHR
jgi:EpsI family protein